MPLIDARFNPVTNQYRCGMADCAKLLCTGEHVKGQLVVRCKCGIDNKIPEQSSVVGYQDRLGLAKK